MAVLCGVMAQGFGVPRVSPACSHCPARLMPGTRGSECPAREVNGVMGRRDGVLTSDTGDCPRGSAKGKMTLGSPCRCPLCSAPTANWYGGQDPPLLASFLPPLAVTSLDISAFCRNLTQILSSLESISCPQTTVATGSCSTQDQPQQTQTSQPFMHLFPPQAAELKPPL